jgi:hypothetical protein
VATLFADDRGLLWGDSFNVDALELSSGHVTKVESHSADGTVGPFVVALSGGRAFWVEPFDAAGDGTIVSASFPGLTDRRVIATASSIASVAVDSDGAYFTTATGTVQRVSLDGGAPETLASGQPRPVAITTDALALYWYDADSLTVMRMAK